MAKPKEGHHDLFAQVLEPLWEALYAEAQENKRSVTAQLEWILQERYPHAVPPKRKRHHARGKAKADGDVA